MSGASNETFASWTPVPTMRSAGIESFSGDEADFETNVSLAGSWEV
jgi:hypothetical protein